MRKVFISYSHQDQLFARSICYALRGAGVDVWYDEHDVEIGGLTPLIKHALQASDILIVLLSPSALASNWVSQEVSWYIQLQSADSSRKIIPIIASEVDPVKVWPTLQDLVRVEGPSGAALPHEKAILRLLEILGLGRPVEQENQPSRAQFGESASELYQKALALYERGLAADSLPLMMRAAEISTDHSERHECLANLGVVQLALSRTVDALQSFDRALAIFDDKQTWFNKSIALERLGRLEEAVDANLAALTLASDFDYDNINYWGHYGELLYKSGRYHEAASAFRQLLHHHPDNDEGALYFASSLSFLSGLDSSTYEEGLDKIRWYRARHPEDLNGLLAEAELLRRLDHPSDALDVLHTSEREFDRSAVYWKHRGAALQDLAEWPLARSSYLQALECDTRDGALLWGKIAECYMAEDDYVNALIAIDSSLSAEKTSAGFSAKGAILKKLGRLTEAVTAYEQALVLDGMNNLARANLAIILKDLGSFDEALAACDRVLETEQNAANRAIIEELKLEIVEARRSAGDL